MSTPQLVVRTPEELAVAIPHMLGFTPEDSLVVFATTPDKRTMLARVDLPRTPADRLEVTTSLVTALDSNINRDRHTGPGANGNGYPRRGQAAGEANSDPDPVMLLCFTEDRPAAERACRELDFGLGLVGLDVGRQLLVHSDAWIDLQTGELGYCHPETANRINAQWVAGGKRLPAGSREELAASYQGDSRPIAEHLPEARRKAAQRSVAEERQWLTAELDRHAQDGKPLSDAAAARALIATSYTAVRDAVLFQTTPDNAVDREAFWADLTRRAPDHLRAPVASLAAFSAWQAGNGAAAWCALDRIPAVHGSYALAGLMTQVLREGVNPSAWFTDSPTAQAAIAAETAHSPGPRPSVARQRGLGRDPATAPGPAPGGGVGHTGGRDHPGRPGGGRPDAGPGRQAPPSR